MNVELIKFVKNGDYTEKCVNVQQMTPQEFKHFEKYGAHDYIEKVRENGKDIDKKLYRVIEEPKAEVKKAVAIEEILFELSDGDIVDLALSSKEELQAIATELGKEFSKMLGVKKLIKLIQE